MSKESKKIVALILAAGESNRLGKPKQNLQYGDTTLLNHIKEHLTLNNVEQTFIVLGAYANDIRAKSNLNDFEVIEFKGWKDGMGLSLAYACAEIFNKNKYDGILISLSDLPLVEKSDYRKMIAMFKQNNDIVATLANGSLGVPAIFGADYIHELQELNGDRGAKLIIQKYRSKVKVYKNEKAAFDVDTFENYSDLLRSIK